MKKIFIAAVSGGKDSTATLLLALQFQKQHPDTLVYPTFTDTCWEHPAVYEYLDYLEAKLNIKIARIKSQKYENLLDLIERKRMFPSATRRFCTDLLKTQPLNDYILEHSTEGEIMNGNVELWLGIRSDESKARRVRYGHLINDDVYEYADVFPNL